MSRNRCSKLVRPLPALLLALAASTSLDAQSAESPTFENFTATTAGLAVGSDEALRINVAAWTPQPEREKFVAAFREKGVDQLTESLESAPFAGYIWTSESLGYTLRYAHREPLPGGGERIILAIDRPLGSWSRPAWKVAEAGPDPSGMTLLEMRLNRQGRGEGKMSFAADIGVDEGGTTLELTNYDKAPVLLKQVQRQKKESTS